MARSPRVPSAPIAFLWRHTSKGDEHLFSAVRERGQRGAEVRIQRYGVAAYSVVANGTMWLARLLDNRPIGSFHCVAAAVLAGDRQVDALRRGEFDAEDCGPSGDAA